MPMLLPKPVLMLILMHIYQCQCSSPPISQVTCVESMKCRLPFSTELRPGDEAASLGAGWWGA